MNRARQVQKTWPFQSKSNASLVHVTTLWTDGTFSCNCPGWTRHVDKRTGERSCWHVRAAEADTDRATRSAAQRSMMRPQPDLSALAELQPKRKPQPPITQPQAPESAAPDVGRARRRFTLED